eukprot:5384689-Amphidinium_carterae.1
MSARRMKEWKSTHTPADPVRRPAPDPAPSAQGSHAEFLRSGQSGGVCGCGQRQPHRKFAKYAQSELWLIHAVVNKYMRGNPGETVALYQAPLDRARQRCGRRSGIQEGDIDAHSVSAGSTLKKEACIMLIAHAALRSLWITHSSLALHKHGCLPTIMHVLSEVAGMTHGLKEGPKERPLIEPEPLEGEQPTKRPQIEVPNDAPNELTDEQKRNKALSEENKKLQLQIQLLTQQVSALLQKLDAMATQVMQPELRTGPPTQGRQPTRTARKTGASMIDALSKRSRCIG